jgi:class 3 adenylate cyclase/tetratricopeptide (TPR) repeat protein
MTVRGARPAVDGLVPYVPRTLLGWGVDAPRYRLVEGSLVSADISGFTALSERLAGFGREGAEELTVLLNRCFGGMIEIVDAHGGDVLKFGGDALLILFTGAGHTERAAASCYAMRALIQRRWSTPLVSRVELGISQGIHSGEFSLNLVDAGFQELWVVGPGMSSAVGCEGAAERGEILLSPDAAARLAPRVLGEAKPGGVPLVADVEVADPMAEWAVDTHDVAPYVPGWLVEQADAGRVAEHRAVTVGFVFFGGVDEVLAQRGPDELQRCLQQLARVVHDALDAHGAFWLASDVYPGGGKIIVTAGAPRSTGQDEDAAVRALRTVLDAELDLPLRAGLNRGHVFMGDLGSGSRRTFTVMGDAVNLAARLMQKSQTGELVASQALLDLVPSQLTTQPLEPFYVKGKTEPISAALVQSVGESVDEPVDAAQPVPFIGREAELDELHAVVEQSRQGSGAVVGLIGEPGIGKSRLVAELVARNPDVDVVLARGGRYSRRSPYFAVRHTLRRLCGLDMATSPSETGEALEAWVRIVNPDLLEWLPLIAIPFDAEVPTTPTVERIGAANRAQKLRDVIGDLLESVLTTTTLVVVEDAHWLDEASDALFAHLSIRSRDLPWVVLALHRTDTTCFATQYRHTRAMVLGDMPEQATRDLALAAVEAGLGATPEQIDDLLANGVTNPLFILELVRAGVALGDATPDSIGALVTARMDMLAATDRMMLREGSVLGSVIDTSLLAEATGDASTKDPRRWAALSSFVEREGSGTLRFSHAMYREVAYEGLSFRRRQQLHGAIGQVLERRAGPTWQDASELLSLHFHAARDWDRSWRYSVTAGDRARSKYATAEAASFYSRALDAPRRTWPEKSQVAKVAEALGDVLELGGRFEQADEALRLARRYDTTPESDVRVLRKLGTLRERQGAYPQALRWYSRGLSRARSDLPTGEAERAEGELSIAYAGVRFRQGDTAGCLEWAHRAESIATEIGDRRMLAHASYLLMIGYGVLRRPEVAHYRDVPLPLFEAEGDLIGQANVLNNLGVDAKEEGRWSQALEFYERSRTAREQAGDVIGAATAMNNIAEILLDQGHLDRAESLFREALRSWRRANYPVGVALATCYLGRLAARRGQHADAALLIDEALERFEKINAGYFVVETQIFRLEARVLADDPGLTGVDDDLVARAQKVGDPLVEAMLWRICAALEHHLGKDEQAERLATLALTLATDIGYTYEAAQALLVRAQARARMGGDSSGDHAEAVDLLRGLGVVLPQNTGGSHSLTG